MNCTILLAAVALGASPKIDDQSIDLGSHLYFRRDMTEAEVRESVKRMKETGLDSIRVYPYWADVETGKGEYDWRLTDACYRACEEFGLKILHTFKPNSPPAWMNLTRSFNLDDFRDVDDPFFREALLKFVKATAERYAKSPALMAWCPWNEPRINLPDRFGPYACDRYREYLKRCYRGDLADLNSRYFHRYASWDDVCRPDAKFGPMDFMDYPERMDYVRYTADVVARLIADVEKTIDAADGRHPHHVNPWIFAGNDSGLLWPDAELSDYLGGSIYPAHWGMQYHSTLHGFVCDVLRSATKHPDRLYRITESQGGMSLFTAKSPLCPDAATLKLWAYDMLGSGSRGIMYWTFEPTVRGEWAIADLDGGESDRSRAIRAISETVNANRALLEAVRPAEPEVYLLDSEHTTALANVRGRWDNSDHYRSSWTAAWGRFNAWAMLQELGLEAGFINEGRLLEGGLERVRTLIAPDSAAVSDAALGVIAEWVKAGGTLVVDGQFARYDEHGVITRRRKAALDGLFGARLKDWLDAGGAKIVTDAGATPVPARDYRGTFADTAANAVTRANGRGRTCWIATRFFGNYLGTVEGVSPHFEPRFDFREVLSPLMPAPSAAVTLENADTRLRLRRLRGRDGRGVVTLLNFGAAKTAVLRAWKAVELRRLDGGGAYAIPAGGKLELPLPANEAVAFGGVCR